MLLALQGNKIWIETEWFYASFVEEHSPVWSYKILRSNLYAIGNILSSFRCILGCILR